MLPVALESVPGRSSLGLIQNLAYPDVWRDILDKVESALAQQGARLVPQVAVRSVGILDGQGQGTSISP